LDCPFEELIITLVYLQGLLEKEVPKRLACGIAGDDDLIMHDFYRPINWDDLRCRIILTPATHDVHYPPPKLIHVR
jgi:hypothetical protein